MAFKCSYVNCVRVVKKKGKSCSACNARYGYWDRKSLADRLERRRKLELSGETMKEFITDSKLQAHEKKLHKKEVKQYAQAQA